MYTFDYMTVFINLVVQSGVRLVYDFAAGDGRVTCRDVGAEVPSERGDVIDLVRSRQQFSIFRLGRQVSIAMACFRLVTETVVARVLWICFSIYNFRRLHIISISDTYRADLRLFL